MPFGHVPVLELSDGERLVQTRAIGLFVARELRMLAPLASVPPLCARVLLVVHVLRACAELAGASSLEQARVHMLVDTFEDMWSGKRNCLLLRAVLACLMSPRSLGTSFPFAFPSPTCRHAAHRVRPAAVGRATRTRSPLFAFYKYSYTCAAPDHTYVPLACLQTEQMLAVRDTRVKPLADKFEQNIRQYLTPEGFLIGHGVRHSSDCYQHELSLIVYLELDM